MLRIHQAALTTAERGLYLDRLADLIDRDVEKIAHVECLDMAMLEESLKLRVIGRGARNFRAYAELAHIYHAERDRRARNSWLSPFVDELLAQGTHAPE